MDEIDKNLNSKWILWIHSPKNKEWDIKSFKKVFTITKVKHLLFLSKNIEKLGIKHNHLYFFREGIEPTWEDINNRNGGTCSFKTDMNYYNKDNTYVIPFSKFLLYKVLGESLISNYKDINGFSISPKNNWAIVKIWNKDSQNDLSNLISQEFNSKFKNLSIRYKTNTPEY